MVYWLYASPKRPVVSGGTLNPTHLLPHTRPLCLWLKSAAAAAVFTCSTVSVLPLPLPFRMMAVCVCVSARKCQVVFHLNTRQRWASDIGRSRRGRISFTSRTWRPISATDSAASLRHCSRCAVAFVVRGGQVITWKKWFMWRQLLRVRIWSHLGIGHYRGDTTSSSRIHWRRCICSCRSTSVEQSAANPPLNLQIIVFLQKRTWIISLWIIISFVTTCTLTLLSALAIVRTVKLC